MNDPSAVVAQLPFSDAAVARKLGIAFLAGVALIAGFAWWDAAHVTEREHFSENTAVGDTNFFTAPAGSAPVFQADGKSWTVADSKKVKSRDTQMVRAVRDDGRGVTLYRPRKKLKADELFVKTAPNAYLQLAPAK